MRPTSCRTCHAAIVWMTTTTGKNIPVDAGSVDEAGLSFDGGKPVFDPCAHVAHFVTCPDADQHRRRRTRPVPGDSIR